MHRNFENWNDMRHEPRKFWLAETIFLIYTKLFHYTISNGESQTGGGCTRAIPGLMSFFNHAHIIYS